MFELLKKEITIVLTFVFVTFFVLVMSWYGEAMNVDNNKTFNFLSIVITIIGNIYVCFFVRYFVGTHKQVKKPQYFMMPVSVWGYSWRCLVVMIVCAVLFVFISLLIKNILPLHPVLLGYSLFIALTPVVAWSLFCNEKKETLQNVIAKFRGY